MYHLLEYINQDIKKRYSKDKDSTVNKTEYRSKWNPTGKPRWIWQQPKHHAPNISSMDKPTFLQMVLVQQNSQILQFPAVVHPLKTI